MSSPTLILSIMQRSCRAQAAHSQGHHRFRYGSALDIDFSFPLGPQYNPSNFHLGLQSRQYFLQLRVDRCLLQLFPHGLLLVLEAVSCMTHVVR